jgi:lipopolysaccharide transport system ATP-binding protein
VSEPTIRATDLGKRYALGEQADYHTLRDVLAGAATRPFRALRRSGAPAERRERPTIWALKDVSFEVREGEVLGLIGANGAGKSTLLKILTRITEPTVGSAEMWGRVGSLLEVGTGFHGELTGRENVFLNGSILGMTRKEIARSFDEIVAFAEMEQFVDTPVKHYSSGMYVRLGFAVAAHLALDIMLVDEVLAVGDAAFQRKCLGKMDEVAREGRTIIFVSHSMTAISQLCTRAVLLEGGTITMDGTPDEVVPRYLESTSEGAPSREWTLDEAPKDERLRLDAVRVRSGGECKEHVDIDEPIELEVEFTILTHRKVPTTVFVDVTDGGGSVVLRTTNTPEAGATHDRWAAEEQAPGRYRAVCTLPGSFLNDRRYFVSVWIGRPGYFAVVAERAVGFSVHDTGGMRDGSMGQDWPGVVRVPLAWRTGPLAETAQEARS